MKQAIGKTIDASEVPGASTCIHCGYPDYRLTSCKCTEESLRQQVAELKKQVDGLRLDLDLVQAFYEERGEWMTAARKCMGELENALESVIFEEPDHRIGSADVLKLIKKSCDLRQGPKKG